jgi:O-antigen/teichoic acid export membrane protein
MTVMTGTALAQVIGFALSPVISRFYTPSEFGVFGTFAAVSSVIAAGVTLEYAQAIMLPRSREDAINLFVVACICGFALSMLCLFVVLLVPGLIYGLIVTSSAWTVALLVLAIFVAGLNQACQAWCIRAKAFGQTSGSQLVRSLSSNGAQVSLGYLRFGAQGLVVSSVLAEVFAGLTLARVVLPDLAALRNSIRWKRMVQLAREYRDFPQYSATMNVLNACSLGLPVLLLTHFYGAPVAGAYVFGIRIIQTPMGLVTGALRQVLFQRASEIHNEGGRLLPVFLKITGGMFAGTLLPSLVFAVWAPQIFAWLFGPQWHQAGEFARSLILWLLSMFCNVPSVLFARIIRIQGRMFVFDLSVLVGRAATLIVGGIYLPATYTILLFSLFGAVMNVLYIVTVGRALYRAEGISIGPAFRAT